MTRGWPIKGWPIRGWLTVAALVALGAQPATRGQPAAGPPATAAGVTVLKVCSDAHKLPQSNDKGGGYENKIAEALARDLKRRIEYTYFPQRMGFVRNTLRSLDDTTHQYKCDLIIGVPKGYDLTATTESYMRSTYAMVVPESAEFSRFKSG